MTTLPQRLKQARANANLSQMDVANKIYINNKTLSNYETAISTPNVDTLKDLADLYQVSFTWLATGQHEQPKPKNLNEDTRTNDTLLALLHLAYSSEQNEAVDMILDYFNGYNLHEKHRSLVDGGKVICDLYGGAQKAWQKACSGY